MESLYRTGAHKLLRPFVSGVGAILMLHHVRPACADAFQPNKHLEITPEFLTETLGVIREQDMDIVSLDEGYQRLINKDFRRRFVCITADDGYRDNVQWALPILRQLNAPLTMYVPVCNPDKTGVLWWRVVEQIIQENDSIEVAFDDREFRMPCSTTGEKYAAANLVQKWFLAHPGEECMMATVRALARKYNVSIESICAETCLDWAELRNLANDPLITIGSHTANHIVLSRAPEDIVRKEMVEGRSRIAAELGGPVDHFAYTYGTREAAGAREFDLAREVGFRTAVTTRPGILFADHAAHLNALPRLSLNGLFQGRRYLEVLLSGAATALWNGFRRVNVA
jgi:peptidoglycan/xylan/chitin deacetylase (PgdA/CDA1 family)